MFQKIVLVSLILSFSGHLFADSWSEKKGWSNIKGSSEKKGWSNIKGSPEKKRSPKAKDRSEIKEQKKSSKDKYHDLAKKYWSKNQKKANGFLKKKKQKKSSNDNSHLLSQHYLAFGMLYQGQKKYAKAAEMYKKSFEAEQKRQYSSGIILVMASVRAGHNYLRISRYKEALTYYKKALKIKKEIGDTAGIPKILHGIGTVYHKWGRYKIALTYFKKALKGNKETGQRFRRAGVVNTAWNVNQKLGLVSNLHNIGNVHFKWGRYKEALKYYKKSLKINEEIDNKSNIASNLHGIGTVYYKWDRYKVALKYYEKSLKISKETGQRLSIAANLYSIGNVYHNWGRYKVVLKYYKKSLKINEEIGNKYAIAINLNGIGTVYHKWGRYKVALNYFKKSLKIDEEFGYKYEIVGNLGSIGESFWKLKDYNKAAQYLNKSIKIIEKLRLTAKGNIRRDYFASQNYSYKALISTYIKDNKPVKAFNTIELSKAKYLVEQMGRKLNEKNIRFSGIKSYQRKLDDDTVIINYANVNWRDVAQLVVTKDDIHGLEVNKKRFIKKVNTKYRGVINLSYQKLRGFKIKSSKIDKKKKEDVQSNADLEKIITYYRHLLSNPRSDPKTTKYISKQLYAFLIKPIEKHLKDKETLIIIPDGILGFLPFETLIMPNGKYLIEKYHIKYAQSLTVSEIINKRNYSKNRKPILAFGGAVYKASTYKKAMISSENQLKSLKKKTYLALDRGKNTKGSYSALGIASWSNLPGTLTEVKAVKKIYKKAVLITGEDVEEFEIKELSDDGELKKYKVIHFATHGIVVPEIPELSAIVLSQLKDDDEDGYLNMREIANLDIQADFVNLSACETGLGKIYGGEGVVGLTQSFLIAGANGLSVSLWQVADESTMKFMVGMYKRVKEKNMSYDKAMTEMKRSFIDGEIGNGKYSHPFFWAPFVYYGK